MEHIETKFKYDKNLSEIASLIDNNLLDNDILKYIAPYFSVDKNDNTPVPSNLSIEQKAFVD